MLTILFLSLNVALLQGIPVAQVSQVSQGKDRCGYNIETTTTQKPKLTTTPSFRLDPFECPVPDYFDPLSKYLQHLLNSLLYKYLEGIFNPKIFSSFQFRTNFHIGYFLKYVV